MFWKYDIMLDSMKKQKQVEAIDPIVWGYHKNQTANEFFLRDKKGIECTYYTNQAMRKAGGEESFLRL